MERSKNHTNHSFFTKTCEQRLYAFRAVSLKKNESASSLQQENGCAKLTRNVLRCSSKARGTKSLERQLEG